MKGFHLFFVFATDVMTLFFGYWAFNQYKANQSGGYLATAIVCMILAVAIIYYGIQFNKKIKM